MKNMKRMMSVFLSVGIMAGLLATPILAAEKKKINTVSLTIKSNIEIGTPINEMQGIEVETKSNKYTVGDYEFTNHGFEWCEDDTPQMKLYLYAADGYYFALKKASSVTLRGATYAGAAKQDASQTLIITMNLPSLKEQTGEIESAVWSSDTRASWESAANAGSYEVRIYRDDKAVGASRFTTETNLDFSSAMVREGNYYYKIRPINKYTPEKKGSWVDSDTTLINSEKAAEIRALVEQGITGGSWKQDEAGWWYQNGDGTYTKNNWQLIDSKWYFFNDKGYMATGWIEWNGKWYYCDLEKGDMLVNQTTPDGYQVGEDGAMK